MYESISVTICQRINWGTAATDRVEKITVLCFMPSRPSTSTYESVLEDLSGFLANVVMTMHNEYYKYNIGIVLETGGEPNPSRGRRWP